jgi:hypothetical protein
MIGQWQTAIRGFSSFPAGSLPRLRFGRRVVFKVLIKNDFSMWGEPQKNFYPEFPCAAGKGRGGATLPLWFLWRRDRLRLRASRFPSSCGRPRPEATAPPLWFATAALLYRSCATQPERAYMAFPQRCKPLSTKESGKCFFRAILAFVDRRVDLRSADAFVQQSFCDGERRENS